MCLFYSDDSDSLTCELMHRDFNKNLIENHVWWAKGRGRGAGEDHPPTTTTRHILLQTVPFIILRYYWYLQSYFTKCWNIIHLDFFHSPLIHLSIVSYVLASDTLEMDHFYNNITSGLYNNNLPIWPVVFSTFTMLNNSLVSSFISSVLKERDQWLSYLNF